MAVIIETLNPFEPFNAQKTIVESGCTIRQWVQRKFPDTGEFPIATICMVNGRPLKREEWDYAMEKDDVVNFVSLPEGELALIIIAVVISVAAVAVSLLMPIPGPNTPGEHPESDPVFSTKGQTNSIRLGEPIEVHYGRNRVYPSLASRPYFEYRNNDQFQFSLFCIGQGEYTIDQIQIGDTAIENFQEVEFEIVPPASKVSLFPTNVFTSPEAGGQELFGTNEDEYVAPGWVGPFPTNEAGTQATQIQLDFVMPKGLYFLTSKGKLQTRTIQIQAQAREINDLGDPIGAWRNLFVEKKTETFTATKLESSSDLETFVTWEWVKDDVVFSELDSGDPAPGTVTTTYSDGNNDDDPTDRAGVVKTVETILTNTEYFEISGATTTPQRRTFRTEVKLGRYEVRVRRTNIKHLSHKDGHDVIWEAMRAFIDVEQVWGNVTLLAVIIRATNNLNSQTQQRFNVICTRMLAIRDTGGFLPEVQATRSIIWAFVDCFRNVYGGRIFSDAFFDWATLESLDDFYTSRGEFFDWTFRDPITVWEAAKAIARVGRAVPLLPGSQISIKRDGPLDIPVALFNQDNIIEGTFQWEIKLWDLDEHDSLQVEYTDPDTGYKQEQVICALPGDTQDNPRNVRFPGIQDRTHAYREGLYTLATERHLRENVSFETGLEGYLPSFGDLIAVVHDVPKWGQGGYVVHAVKGSSGTYHLWLSEPVEFISGQSHQVFLRGKTGNTIGPLDALETNNLQQIQINSSEDIDFLLGGENEPMLFLFGVANDVTKYLKVIRVEPQGGERIRITGVNDSAIIHSFDDLVPAPIGQRNVPPETPALPTVSGLEITQIDGPLKIVQVSWNASFGAQQYVVQTSHDNENWEEKALTTRTSVQFQTRPGTLYVRVAALNEGQGPWSTASIEVGFLSGINISSPWGNETSWTVSWSEVLDSRGYQVRVHDNSASNPVLKSTTNLGVSSRSFTYDLDDAQLDGNVVREMMVEVDALFEDDTTGNLEVSGSPVQEDLSNPIPSPPTNPSHTFITEDSTGARYRLDWTVPQENDLIRVKVWLSASTGFDPAVLAPEYEETVSAAGHENIPAQVEVSIPLDSSGAHSEHYWRVAVFDVWGNEITTNITAEQVIPAYP